MKGPAKAALIAVAAVAIAGAAFWGGMTYQGSKTPSGRTGFPGANGTAGQGGPMGNLTAAEQAQLNGMTASERQAFMQKKFGSSGQGGPQRGGSIQGTVLEVAADNITIKLSSGGSQTIYTDKDTVIAYQEGAAKLAAGSKVMVSAPPSTSGGVTTATLLVVLK